MLETGMKIKALFISPKSKYYSGKIKDGIFKDAEDITPASIECHAGKGIVGDRFYDYKENYKGQISFISYELHLQLKEFIKKDFSINLYRRNVFLEGGDPLKEFLGKRFQIGNAIFEGVEDCSPCKFMEQMIGEGALNWMNQNHSGGLRARIIQSGEIKIGDQVV
jgi:MOSC domain-containing protein YiiM